MKKIGARHDICKRIIVRTKTVRPNSEKTGSTTSLVARQCRLNQWAEQVRECQERPDGMPVREWYSLQGITKANYYYRLRQVRKACLEPALEEPFPQSVVPVPRQIMVPASEAPSTSRLDIYANGFCIHVTESTSSELLSRMLKVAAHFQ